MDTPERPDPDQLLVRLERDSAKAKRGRLKIFFGSVAGVGKTCAMLRAAHERIQAGGGAGFRPRGLPWPGLERHR